MNYQEVINQIDLRFTSGNIIPVECATIKAKEWEILKTGLGILPNNPHKREDMVQYAEALAEYFEQNKEK